MASPPVQERLRPKAAGVPTFPTLQRHQVTVIVKRCDDNMHKVELTLRSKQYNSQIHSNDHHDSSECHKPTHVNTPRLKNSIHYLNTAKITR